MSTSYYRLRAPITSLRVEEKDLTHIRIRIWISHEFSGELVLADHAEVSSIILMFALYEDDDKCPLRAHWGGKDRGAIVTVNDDTLADSECVISEYGELLTVGEVKARDGAKRSDGAPTELFGYEKVKK